MRFFSLILGAAILAAAPAAAQNVSSVSGTDVKPGEDAIEYRAAYAPEDDGRPGLFGQRIHYHHAFDDSWRLRVILLQSERAGEGFETRAVNIEVLKQFLESEENGGWDSGIRIDGTIPTEDRPGRARIAWLNGFEIGKRWQARANIYVGKEIGDAARDGLTLETREELMFKVNDTLRVGAQMFNGFNTTAEIGSFNEQRHQIGPAMKLKLSKHAKMEASALFGVSRAASDADLRVFLIYEF